MRLKLSQWNVSHRELGRAGWSVLLIRAASRKRPFRRVAIGFRATFLPLQVRPMTSRHSQWIACLAPILWVDAASHEPTVTRINKGVRLGAIYVMIRLC